MDKLTAIKLFTRTVQLGSFTAAAEEEGSTQSSVSKKIAALEKELGVALLHRSSRKQALTDAGEEYYQFALTVLEEFDEIESNLQQKESSPTGKLKISAPIAFGQQKLTPLLIRFKEHYPHIQLDIVLSDHIVDLTKESVDVAIRAQHLDDSNLRARYLFNNALTVIASPRYLSRMGMPQVPSQLTQHNCLTYSLSSTLRHYWYFNINEETQKVAISGDVISNSADTLLQLALQGMGIVALPSWMVKDHLNNGELIELFAEANHAYLPMYAIYKRAPYTPTRIRCFIDFLAKEYTQDK